jgi:hypothetical protein
MKVVLFKTTFLNIMKIYYKRLYVVGLQQKHKKRT